MQTDYNMKPPVGIRGQISTLESTNIVTKICDTDIAFGLLVVNGADSGNSVKLPSAQGDSFEGVIVFTHKQQVSRNVSLYQEKEPASIMKRGKIWVESTVAVSYGDTVYIINTGDDVGKITNVSGTNTPTGVKVTTGNDGAGLCEIELNLP